MLANRCQGLKLEKKSGSSERKRQIKMRASAYCSSDALRVVCVDDWAWKKGHNYGTILVDLEKRRVIDLLPDRCAKQVADWLRQHSTVELVSHDRFGLYAQAAIKGAPQAQQIADRFHLLMNLKEAVEKELSRQRDTLVISPLVPDRKATFNAATLALVNSRSRSERSALDQEIMYDRRRARQIQFEQIHRLYRSGKNVTVIAKEMGIGRKTRR
jgi:transposase